MEKPADTTRVMAPFCLMIQDFFLTLRSYFPYKNIIKMSVGMLSDPRRGHTCILELG